MAEPELPLRFTMDTGRWRIEIRGAEDPTDEELSLWQAFVWAAFGPDADLPPSTSAAS